MYVTFGSKASWSGSTKSFSNLTLSFPRTGWYDFILK